jgi:hypothetical protein
MKNISKEDYVLWNYKTKKLIEDVDTVYHFTTVVELLNDGFQVHKDEEFIAVHALPIPLQKIISDAIENTK